MDYKPIGLNASRGRIFSFQFGCENMLGYLSLDIICSSKLTVFLELRSRKTVRFSEQIMSADKYPSIFSRQMKPIVYIKYPLCETNASYQYKKSVVVVFFF